VIEAHDARKAAASGSSLAPRQPMYAAVPVTLFVERGVANASRIHAVHFFAARR
jgi:hypothetical protein